MFIYYIFQTSDFPPRWQCGRWTPLHGWLYILSDLAIWAAYLAIPCALGYFLARRKSPPFPTTIALFVMFIFACGTTHLLDAVMFWWPAYRLSAVVRFATAVISWATVVALVPLVPKALSLRHPAELEQEIATRCRVETALRESEERFRRMTDAAPAILWVSGPDGRPAFFSHGWSEFTGQSAERALGDGWLSLVHPDDRDVVGDRLREANERRDRFQCDFRVRAADGSYRWVFDHGRPWYGAAGEFLGYVGSVIDITERKQADEDLRRSEARFRTFVDHATDCFFLHDENGTVLDANRQATECLGYRRDELIGMSPRDLAPEVPADHAAASPPPAAPDESVAFDTRYRRKDGTLVPVEVRLRRFAVGDRRYAVSLVGDISVRKAAEDRLRDALSEKQVLLREIHHRVKNNLQVICSLLDLQARQTAAADPAELLREAQDRVYSMALIHEQLYQQDTLSNIDFADYLRGLAGYLTGTYHRGHLDLAVALDLERSRLPVDTAVPCGLIFNELISNVLKHAFTDRRRGAIRVTLAEEGGLTVLTVADDGGGIPDGVDPSKPRTLGLRLVTALADQLRGSVSFQRHGGTTVRVAFPTPPAGGS